MFYSWSVLVFCILWNKKICFGLVQVIFLPTHKKCSIPFIGEKKVFVYTWQKFQYSRTKNLGSPVLQIVCHIHSYLSSVDAWIIRWCNSQKHAPDLLCIHPFVNLLTLLHTNTVLRVAVPHSYVYWTAWFSLLNPRSPICTMSCWN